jgi:multidrug efflux pump subunit AcrA (membrane-fusion protein)
VRSPTVTRPNRWLDAGLAIVVVVFAIAAYVVTGPPKQAAAAVRTTPVTRGVVVSSVQASGNVQAGQSFSAGFQTSGTVTDIDVHVGDTVTKGEALAHLDPTIASANLASAQAGLTSAQAKLVQLEQIETPAQRAQDAAGLASAQQQVSVAQQGVTTARNNASIDASQLSQAVTTAQQKLNTDTAAKASANQISQDQTALTQAQNAQTNGVNKDQQAITQANDQLAQSQLQLNSTVAGNNVKEQPPQQGDLASAQGSVTQARAQLTQAEQTMGYTTLVSPADGVVSAINGLVGQTVSGSGISVSQGTTTASAGGGSGSSASSSSSGSSSSSAFMTITNLSALTVKAGFAETDAAKLQLGQPAAISFNALPNTQAAGTVSQIDVNSTLVSNVVTYFATVAITEVPPNVKPGMTASVTVTVNRREGVLTLPSAAVRGSGSTGTVTVLTGKQQTARTVGVGLRGDTTTEITSGVNAGDTVVLPTSTLSGVSSQLSNNIGRFLGGAGGLGGGGLGGGGGGGARGG